MMLSLELSAPQWEDVIDQLLLANLWLQGACLFVALPWLVVSIRRLRAVDLPTVAETGWAPFRDQRLLRGSLSIILALLVQTLFSAAVWSIEAAQTSACDTYGENTTECGGMQWLGPVILLVVSGSGALVFSVTLHLVALRYIRAAWEANKWTRKMSIRERPALTIVRMLRYSPFVWFVWFLVGTVLALPFAVGGLIAWTVYMLKRRR